MVTATRANLTLIIKVACPLYRISFCLSSMDYKSAEGVKMHTLIEMDKSRVISFCIDFVKTVVKEWELNRLS